MADDQNGSSLTAPPVLPLVLGSEVRDDIALPINAEPSSPPPWPPHVGLDLPHADSVLSMSAHDTVLPADVGPLGFAVAGPSRSTEEMAVDVPPVAQAGGEPKVVNQEPLPSSSTPNFVSDSAESRGAIKTHSGEHSGASSASASMPPMLAMAPFSTTRVAFTKRTSLRSPVWSYFEKAVVRNGVATANVRSQEGAPVTSSSSSNLTREHTKPILSFIEEHSKQRMESLHSSVQKFIVLSEQPCSLVSETAFQELIKDFDKKYRMMSPPTLVARLTRDCTEERALLKASLQSVQFVSLTTDLWTSTAGDPFAGITAHFTDGPELVARTLSCSLIPYPHKKEAIADVLFEAMEAFVISDKVVSISADGASNMRGAVPLLQQKVDARSADTASNSSRILSIWCLGHVINLTVQTAISSVKDVADLLTKLRSWAAFFRTHPKQMQALDEAQDLLKKPHCTPKGDTPARWNSALAMLESTENLANGFDIYLTTLESHAQAPGNKDAKKRTKASHPLGCLVRSVS